MGGKALSPHPFPPLLHPHHHRRRLQSQPAPVKFFSSARSGRTKCQIDLHLLLQYLLSVLFLLLRSFFAKFALHKSHQRGLDGHIGLAITMYSVILPCSKSLQVFPSASAQSSCAPAACTSSPVDQNILCHVKRTVSTFSSSTASSFPAS
jgi:hypothetical protein